MTRTDSRGGGEAPGVEAGRDGGATGETLESFVAQLHDEGVEAGRKEAEGLVRKARVEAEEIVRRARSEADGLVEEARERAAEEEARGRAELELAARDAVLKLQAALSETLTRIVARSAEAPLQDADFLGTMVREVVRAYARADAADRPTEVRVPRSLAERFEAWWSRELGDTLRREEAPEVVSSPLLEAGFEYRVTGGTVEVSVDATVETLMELVRPRLRELIDRGVAAEETGSGGPALAGVAHAAGDHGG